MFKCKSETWVLWKEKLLKCEEPGHAQNWKCLRDSPLFVPWRSLWMSKRFATLCSLKKSLKTPRSAGTTDFIAPESLSSKDFSFKKSYKQSIEFIACFARKLDKFYMKVHDRTVFCVLDRWDLRGHPVGVAHRYFGKSGVVWGETDKLPAGHKPCRK